MTIEREKKTALEIVAEWLGLLAVICFLLWAGLLHAQQMQGPTAMPQLNTDYYVGSVPGFYSTIQSAVTKTCTTSGARTVIPAGATPSDTIGAVTGGCTQGFIEDRRVLPSVQYSWNGTAYIAAASGGGSPVGPLQAIQSKGSTGFAGSNGALQDTVGNTYLKSYGGTLDAYINQTTPTSNDGISNSLQSPGAWVTVNQGYAATEGIVDPAGYRSPFGVVGVNPGLAAGTGFCDVRASNVGCFYYNSPGVGGQAAIDIFSNNDVPQNPGGGYTWNFHPTVQVKIGSGKNQENLGDSGEWDISTLFPDTMINLTRGISTYNTVQAYKGQGDFQAYQSLIRIFGDDPDGSGEGKANHRDQNIEDGSLWYGAATSTFATGATTLEINTGGSPTNPPWPYDGNYLTDSTQAGAPFYMAIGAGPDEPTQTPGTIVTASHTWTPDNWGKQTEDMADGAVPQLYNGAGTPVTVTVAGFSATPVGTTTMCVGDQFNDEQITPTSISYSAGTATFTANYRFWHPAGATYAQGPQACKYLEVLANQAGVWRNMIQIIGASDAHTLMYSAHLFGTWGNEPMGSFSTMNLPTGTVFTRDSSGVVTVTIAGSGPNGAGWNGLELTINANSGLSSNYFGSWDVTEVDGGSDAVLTFPTGVSGAAGTATSTGPVYISKSMVEANTGRLMPGAEIVYAGDPVTHVMNGKVGVATNNMTVASGDQLESHTAPEVVQDIEHTTLQMLTPTSGNAPSIMYDQQVSGRPQDGFTVLRVIDSSEANYFLGDGGTHSGMNYKNFASTASHYNNYWTMNAPMSAGSIHNITFCPGKTATQCSNVHDAGWFGEKVGGPSWGYSRQFNNAAGRLTTSFVDFSGGGGSTTDYLFSKADYLGSPGSGWVRQSSDPANGTASWIGADHTQGAYLEDGITGTRVQAQASLITLDPRGGGNAVTLTPSALKYGTDTICTSTLQPCSAGAATSLAGGSSFVVPYQSAPNTTAFTPAPSTAVGDYFMAEIVTSAGTPTAPQLYTPALLGIPLLGANNAWGGIQDFIAGGSSNGSWAVQPATPATSSANVSGPAFSTQANYWNGSASATDSFNWSNVQGTGTNPTATLTLAHVGSTGAVAVAIPFNITTVTQTSTTNNTTVATTNYVKNVVGVSNAVTSATAGTGVTSVTCATAACTNLRGTYTIVGGTATTGVIATLLWPTTTTAYACMITQNGGTSMFALAHSVATATGMTISSDLTVTGATFAVDYQCQP